MFHQCLAQLKVSSKVSDVAHKAIADAVFSYVSIVAVTAIVNGCKTITEKHVNTVEELLIKQNTKKKSKSQSGGNGMDVTGISTAAYSAGNAAGSGAGMTDMNNGLARTAHVLTHSVPIQAGGAAMTAACVSAIKSSILKEVDLILKDQHMRKKAGIIALITQKIEMRVACFLQPLVSNTGAALRVSDVKKSAKIAFRGLRIIYA